MKRPPMRGGRALVVVRPNEVVLLEVWLCHRRGLECRKLRQVDVLTSQGMPLSDPIRSRSFKLRAHCRDMPLPSQTGSVASNIAMALS